MTRASFFKISLLPLLGIQSKKPFVPFTSNDGFYCICGKKLSESEIYSLQPHHFNRTCFEHRKYATQFQILDEKLS